MSRRLNGTSVVDVLSKILENLCMGLIELFKVAKVVIISGT